MVFLRIDLYNLQNHTRMQYSIIAQTNTINTIFSKVVVLTSKEELKEVFFLRWTKPSWQGFLQLPS